MYPNDKNNANEYFNNGELTPVSSLIERRVSKLLEGEEQMKMGKAINTGVKDFDELIGGLYNGQLVVISGNSDAEKTSLAMRIVRNVAVHQGKPVFYFSTTESIEQITNRFISDQSDKQNDNGYVEHLQEISKALARSDVYIGSNSRFEIQDIIMQIGMAPVSASDLGLIVIESLRDLLTESSEHNSFVTKTLKQIALKFDVPVLVLSDVPQKNRPVDDSKILLSDFRQYGELDSQADVITFITRRADRGYDNDDSPKIDWTIAKNRIGSIGEIQIAL